MRIKNRNIILNIVKLIFVIAFGSILGIKLILPGNPLMIMLFFIICGISGVVLSKIN